MRHLNNGTDHRHSKSRCDQSSPARRTMILTNTLLTIWHYPRWPVGPLRDHSVVGGQLWGREEIVIIFHMTFSNAFSLIKMYRIPIKISLKFVPDGPINNIPALFQIMAWCRPGDKPLSEPMMVSSITRPQWVIPINNIPELFQIMAWRRPGDKPLSEPMMVSSITRPHWVIPCLYSSWRIMMWNCCWVSTAALVTPCVKFEEVQYANMWNFLRLPSVLCFEKI